MHPGDATFIFVIGVIHGHRRRVDVIEIVETVPVLPFPGDVSQIQRPAAHKSVGRTSDSQSLERSLSLRLAARASVRHAFDGGARVLAVGGHGARDDGFARDEDEAVPVAERPAKATHSAPNARRDAERWVLRRAVGVGIGVCARALVGMRASVTCSPAVSARRLWIDLIDRLISRRFDSIRFKSRARYFFIFWIDFGCFDSIGCEREVVVFGLIRRSRARARARRFDCFDHRSARVSFRQYGHTTASRAIQDLQNLHRSLGVHSLEPPREADPLAVHPATRTAAYTQNTVAHAFTHAAKNLPYSNRTPLTTKANSSNPRRLEPSVSAIVGATNASTNASNASPAPRRDDTDRDRSRLPERLREEQTPLLAKRLRAVRRLRLLVVHRQ